MCDLEIGRIGPNSRLLLWGRKGWMWRVAGLVVVVILLPEELRS